MAEQGLEFYAFFCDDVRFEIGDKHTFVGAYAGEMVFPPGTPFPVLVTRLGVMFAMTFAGSSKPDSVTFRFELGKPSEYVVLFENTLEAGGIDQLLGTPLVDAIDELLSERRYGVRGALTLPPFEVNEPSFVRVTAIADGEQHFIGRLKITVGTEQ